MFDSYKLPFMGEYDNGHSLCDAPRSVFSSSMNINFPSMFMFFKFAL